MELRRALILATFFIVFQGLNAQQNVQGLVKAYERYQAKLPAQKLFISFNQEKYFPGDTVFFKAYLLSADLGLCSGSQIVEVNLLDSSGHVRKEAKIKTQNGTGSNQLVLPTDLDAGFYNFTAFTNWMRNFDVGNMFQQNLMVVTDKQIVPAESPLEFGIEGRNLIDGLLSHVVVKTEQAASVVYLKDQNDQILDSILTDANGFGTLKLLSAASKHYALETGQAKVNLPMVKPSGYNISVHLPRSPTEDVRMLVSAKPIANVGSALSFIITSRGKVVYSEAISSNLPRVGKSIAREQLAPGLYEISLLSGEGELLSYREFYLNNEGNDPVHVELSPETVQPRQTVGLSVHLADKESDTRSELTVSVLNAEMFSHKLLNLEEEIILQDRLTWFAPWHENTNVPDLIDKYLILKPKPINWSTLRGSAELEPTFGISTLFQLVGQAKDSTGSDLPVGSRLMFYLQNDLMRYEVDVLQEGRFVLNLLDIYGQEEFFVMAETPSGEEVLQVQVNWIETPLPPFGKAAKVKVLDQDDAYAHFTSKNRRVEHSFEFFSSPANLDSLANMNRNEAPQVPILEADNTFNVQDFYLFPTFTEFINEVVRPLRVGQHKGKPIVRVKFLEPNEAKADPLYIIDGIATKNTAFFLSLDPKQLKTVSIIKYPRKLSRFGEMAKNGIVIVNSKLGNIREPLDESKLFYGLSKAMPFPNLTTEWAEGGKSPKFRSTIYWNPTVKADTSGKVNLQFLTSDDAAPLFVLVEGFVDGKPLRLSKRVSGSSLGQY